MDSGQDVVLKVGEADPLEAARVYSMRHPDFRGRIDVHSLTVTEGTYDVPVHLWGIFEITAPGQVEWVFAQFGQVRTRSVDERGELPAARRGA